MEGSYVFQFNSIQVQMIMLSFNVLIKNKKKLYEEYR